MQSRADILTVRQIAQALGDLNQDVVFVGGAVISLYVTDPGAPEMRPTQDVDLFVEVINQKDLEALRQKLVRRGFTQSPEDEVICRFRFEGIYKIDVMSTKAVGRAPANPWFAPGKKDVETRIIEDQTIRVLSFPYFLASKFAAFHSRGSDARTSKDFEDVVYLLDNREEAVSEILKTDAIVKEYLRAEFSEMSKNPSLQEAILSHLEPESQTSRYHRLQDLLTRCIQAI